MADEKKPEFDPRQLNPTPLAKTMPTGSRQHQRMVMALEDNLQKSETIEIPLTKSAVTTVQDLKRGGQIQRLAFEEDPTAQNFYQSLYKPKHTLLPDSVLKQIAIRDDLVAAILLTRSNQVSAFGRELQDRFATGFRIEPRRGIMEDAEEKQKEELQRRITRASKLLSSCGSIDGVNQDDRMSLATFLALQVRNGLVFGRFATEIIYVRDASNKPVFHSFRPADAGTIYMAAPSHDSVDSIRKQALNLLKQIKGKDGEKLKPEKFANDEYAWVQVIEGKPRQAFTPEEMVVYNLFPITDVELRGYPLTPMDNAISAIETHLNITSHNRLYFQSGRAARGMIVIKSTDVDQGLVHQIRQHFNASINNVTNAWRVPVFGIDPDDSVEWAPLDQAGGRDMEFQYLADSNARTICSAFLISPEELPGYQHLSRGTNSQSLSESNNEYKLEAARDVGIRPLLNQFQDFINDVVLPLLDPELAKLCTLKLYGLDADTAEKESTRLQQDQALHMTMDEILERVEKDPLGPEWGGKVLLNPMWQATIEKYLYHGEIVEHFFDRKDASKDESLKFVQNPFWFQFQQLKMQTEQMEMQQQQMQQQAQAQAQQAPQGDSKDKDSGQGPQQPESELSTGADQVIDALGKAEHQLPPNKRRLLARHKAIVEKTMSEWEKESKEMLAEVANVAKKKE
jgi:hypothetical protein